MAINKKAAIGITLVSTLLLVFSIQCMTVYATDYGASNFYTTNYFVPDGESTPQDQLGGHEVQNTQLAFNQISSLMQQQTYYYWYYWEPWWPYHQEPVYQYLYDHGSSTNPSMVQNEIAYSRTNGYWSTDLYVGHMAFWPPASLFTEGFENGNLNNWGTQGNIWCEQGNPHGQSSWNARAWANQANGQSCLWKSIPSSPIVYAQAYIKFLSLDVPQGERLELLDLQSGDWENSVFVCISNPYGTPVWTLVTSVNGYYIFTYGPANDTPVTGYYYNVQLTRDLSNGQAKLYVTTRKTVGNPGHEPVEGNYTTLETSQNRIMTGNTNVIGAGITWLSSSHYNEVAIDDILVKCGNNNYGFLGGVPSEQRWNETYPADHPELNTWDNATGVYGQTQYGSNEHFVFLWVCQNADVEGSYVGGSGLVHGMAYAWSNGAITNDGYNDGYRYPDSANYALISWQDTSPWLTDYMGTSGPYPGNSGTPNIFKYFLVFFYYWALQGYNWYSVNQALDLASYTTGYYNFAYATFAYPNGGYWSYFPWDTNMSAATFAQGFMRVYGNGNIYLPQTQDIWTW